MHGGWSITTGQYAGEVRRWASEVGGLCFAAAMDWMCEPAIRQKTGLSVLEHQRRTVLNYLELRTLAPEQPWLPVLQGWERADYLRHRDQYASAGVDLASLPLVGLGSVCRRQDTAMAEDLIRELEADGIRLHGFGFKIQGLRRVGDVLTSADSMAWSFQARRSAPLPGHTHGSCANCLEYALWWRRRVVEMLGRVASRPRQGLLFAE